MDDVRPRFHGGLRVDESYGRRQAQGEWITVSLSTLKGATEDIKNLH
jgi:hypothetical protein